MPDVDPDFQALLAYVISLRMGADSMPPAAHQELPPLPFLDRAADPEHGRLTYISVCAACHGSGGAGKSGAPGTMFVPPLWGPGSFNDGAGMARLSVAARFIRANMPDGVSWPNVMLSQQDAWDVAAYLESKPRPHMEGLERDFPNRAQKPYDVAYGPFADILSAATHKFGPFPSAIP